MGGNRRQKKSFSSFFSIFKSKGSQKAKYTADEPPNMLKIWPGNDEGVLWVAEPGIDNKASAFIAKFHESCVAAAN